MAAVAQLKAMLKMDNRQYKAGVRDSTNATKSFQSILSGVGASIAAAFSVGAIINFGRKLTQLGSEMSDLATQAGLTTDQYQALEFAALRAGVAKDKIRTVMSKLNVVMGQAQRGMKTYVDLFSEVGISAENLKDMSVPQVLEQIAYAMSTAERGTKQFGAGLELIGTRSGAQLIEVLKELSEKGLAGMEKDAKSAFGYLDNEAIKTLDELEDSVQLLSRSLMGMAAGPLAKVVDGFRELVTFKMKLDKILDPSKSLNRGFGGPGTKTDASSTANFEKTQQAAMRDAAATRIAMQARARQEAEDKIRADKLAQTEAKRQAKIDQYVNRRQAILGAARDKLQALKDRDLSGVTGEGVAPSGMEQMGGFVGSSRSGVGIADRQLNVAEETKKIAAERLKVANKAFEQLKELNQKMKPSGTV